MKYHLAATEGRNGGKEGENPDKLFSSRLVVNFWNPEPGYFNKTTYYGEKDILALGLTYEHQNNAAGDGITTKDFTGWSIDLMIEKKLASGAVAGLESAYYNYDIERANDTYFREGESFYSTASYLFAGKWGPGKLQPHVRYIQFDYIGTGIARSWDIGTNYIIKGHAMRGSLVYRTQQLANSNQWHDSVILGFQGRF